MLTHHIMPRKLAVVTAVIFATLLLALTASALSGWDRAQASSVNALSAADGLRVLRSDQSGIVVELSVSAVSLHTTPLAAGTYQRLAVAGFDATSEPGKPQLPRKSVLLGVPPDAKVSVQVLKDDAITVSGYYHLTPAPSPLPITDDLQPGQFVDRPDAAAYASEALYPGAVAQIGDDAWLRDQRLVRIDLYPFQYTPARGTLVWHRDLQIEVRFERSGLAQPATKAPSVSEPFEPILRDALLNYEIAKAWRAAPQTYGAVAAIKTPDRLDDTTPRYKVVVDHDGVYRLTYGDLQAAGLDVNSVDPRTFHMTSQGRDVAINVIGESDGQFDPGDYVLFYGQKLRGDIIASQHITESNYWMTYPNGWHPQFNATMVERYTDENVYWLTAGGSPGPRMTTRNGTPGGSAPVIDHYTATVHAEQVALWRSTTFTGEDSFFWDSFVASVVTTTRTYTVALSAVVTNNVTATVRGDVVGNSFNFSAGPDHRTQFYMNAMASPFEDSVWDSNAPVRHSFHGPVPQTELVSGTNQLKVVVIPQPAVPNDNILFDWFEVSYARRFEAQNDRLFFWGDQSGPRRYAVSNLATNAVTIFDVSNPFLPQQVLSSSVTSAGGAYTASFEINSSTPVTYYLSGADALQSAKRVERYVPPDLSGAANGADYLIITHRSFYTAVQPLANYRASRGLRVKVIDIDDLYNQFNYGIYHPIAIKDFLAYAVANWQPPAPAYVLLVGDGHWNFKGYTVSTSQGVVGNAPNYIPPNIAWVDPWQGEVDSTNLLANVVGNDLLPDLLIGRLPVNTVTDTHVIVNKIINSESNPAPAAWQQHALFISDNVPDAAGDFTALSDDVIHDFIPASYTADKIYLNNLGCQPSTTTPCPQVNYAITNTFNLTGALLVNYIGHASLNRWAHEKVLVNANIPTLTNLNRLPVILSMTCLDGYWNFPNVSGLMEEMLRAPNGGMVSSFSPTGLGVASGHDSLERGFYTAVFSDGVQEIGAAAVAGKMALYATGANYDLINTFGILGDPALRLPTYALALSPASDSRAGAAGHVVTYALQVSNQGFLTDTVTLSVGGNAWAASVGPGSLTVPAGQSAGFAVTVTVPITAVVNSADHVIVKAASFGDETMATSILTTTVHALPYVFLPLVRR